MIYIKTSSTYDCQCMYSISVMKVCKKVTYGDVSKKELLNDVQNLTFIFEILKLSITFN